MSQSAAFVPADSQLFFSRGDVSDPRMGELARALPPSASANAFGDSLKSLKATAMQERVFVMAGYPDDEGIRLNHGRPGAVQAPTEVRRAFYKMTPPLLENRKPAVVWDAGDLKLEKNLIERHAVVRAYAEAALGAGVSWIGIGGGHDYGFADGAAFCAWSMSVGKRPLVINFDAHLDVRPFQGIASSGTPFRRLLETYPEIDFAEIGVQSHCNSRSHFEWAKDRGARVLTQEEWEASGEPLVVCVTRLLGDWLLKPRPVFLSVDIDGFSNAVAPGCSQSWATGFMPAEFFPLLSLLTHRLDVRMLGVYEVSPPLDHDSRTSKLAAQILHRCIG